MAPPTYDTMEAGTEHRRNPVTTILGLVAGRRQTEYERQNLWSTQFLGVRLPLCVAFPLPSVPMNAGTATANMPILRLSTRRLLPAATILPAHHPEALCHFLAYHDCALR